MVSTEACRASLMGGREDVHGLVQVEVAFAKALVHPEIGQHRLELLAAVVY